MAAVANATATSLSYVWEDPGDSIMVQVGLDLVERLTVAIQQGLGDGPRGNEIGGILLGRMLPGFGRAVLIEDFEVVSCEHLRGASYTLSPKDKRLLGTRLARRPPRQVVGYFRSHTRPGMYLDQEDFAVFSQFFPEAWQVFLLVTPAKDGSGTGGFFFWEEGDINRRATYRPFPFDAAKLATGGFPISGGQSVVQPVAPAPKPVASKPVPVPVTASKPVPTGEPPRLPRRLPSLPWIVVPVIAVLFLIAGLFVSENQPASTTSVAVKPVPRVESLLPEPVEHPAQGLAAPKPAPVSAEPAANVLAPDNSPSSAAAVPPPAPATAVPAGTAADQTAKPTTVSRQKAKKPAPKAAVVPPVMVAHAPAAHEVEQPPVLSSLVGEPKFSPVLPARVHTAPPPEAEVTYEAPHPGVFKRALHKIEGSGEPQSSEFVPASPIHRASAIKPADAGAESRTVDVKVFIDEAGNVTRAQALNKASDLTNAALLAAREWRFTPARKHDKAVSSEMVLHFRF